MSMSDPLNHLGSLWYHSKPLEFPYSPNQFLGWDFFAVSYSKTALKGNTAYGVSFDWCSFEFCSASLLGKIQNRAKCATVKAETLDCKTFREKNKIIYHGFIMWNHEFEWLWNRSHGGC